MARSNKRSYSSLEIGFESLLYRAFSEYAAPRDECAFARCASSRAISIACVESFISQSRPLRNTAGPQAQPMQTINPQAKRPRKAK